MDDEQEARIRSGRALQESMGDFRVVAWDTAERVLRAAFTVRREYCHTNGTIAQGGLPDVYSWSTERVRGASPPAEGSS